MDKTKPHILRSVESRIHIAICRAIFCDSYRNTFNNIYLSMSFIDANITFVIHQNIIGWKEKNLNKKY